VVTTGELVTAWNKNIFSCYHPGRVSAVTTWGAPGPSPCHPKKKRHLSPRGWTMAPPLLEKSVEDSLLCVRPGVWVKCCLGRCFFLKILR